jgi:hypothetical protein
MFPNTIGGALDLDNLADRVIKPVLKANGLEWKEWHAYRRGLATNLHELGVPDIVIQAISRWLAERRAELLPVSYFHIVFTLPHELSALALQNKRLLYDLLFRASAATLLELAGDPNHLGADIGFLGVLHTRGQNLQHHPHIHYVVPAGGLAPNGSRWVASSRRFFLPVGALSRVFRGKFAAALQQLFKQNRLQFHGSLQHLASPKSFRCFLRQLFRTNWVVYAKPPFGGPEHVLHYLARYTHRVAISNHRLVAFQMIKCHFAGKTMRAAAGRRS